MKNKIIKTDLINWRLIDWLQPKNFKNCPATIFDKLKNSLKNNDFIQPFNVWECSDNKIYILDGHHRKRALLELEAEGFEIPELLPANFIECQNKKEAIKFVLLYTSQYATVVKDGLNEWLEFEDIDLKGLELDVELPYVEFSDFNIEESEIENNESESEIETQKIILNYNNADFLKVKMKLYEIAETPELAILKLLGI